MSFANLAHARRVPAPDCLRDALADAREAPRLREEISRLEDEAP